MVVAGSAIARATGAHRPHDAPTSKAGTIPSQSYWAHFDTPVSKNEQHNGAAHGTER